MYVDVAHVVLVFLQLENPTKSKKKKRFKELIISSVVCVLHTYKLDFSFEVLKK